ncbi:DUF3862 domain-containing protein [Lentilactobacillus kisonensis]|uniref:DUF3862 domain-containing protein n=1 Tax=Lentilactobacillus kisonensis TaxID=481722 RepID=UPI000AEFA363|nr:DUF3862 domain-containing protein [Lentilactobacillus kisonensis]
MSACSQSKSAKTSTTSSDQAITRSDYNRIKLANIDSPKAGGASEQAVKRSFGSPASKNRVTINNGKRKTAIQYSWTKVTPSFKASAVTVEFLNGHAVGKGYLTIKNPRFTSSKSLKQIKNGTSYNQVIQKLGNPNAESKTGSGNLSATITRYITSKKGNTTTLMFTGNKLQSKNQTSVK